MPVITPESESPIEKLHTLKEMPTKKSPGHDDIKSEMLVAAGDIGISELAKL